MIWWPAQYFVWPLSHHPMMNLRNWSQNIAVLSQYEMTHHLKHSHDVNCTYRGVRNNTIPTWMDRDSQNSQINHPNQSRFWPGPLRVYCKNWQMTHRMYLKMNFIGAFKKDAIRIKCILKFKYYQNIFSLWIRTY